MLGRRRSTDVEKYAKHGTITLEAKAKAGATGVNAGSRHIPVLMVGRLCGYCKAGRLVHALF